MALESRTLTPSGDVWDDQELGLGLRIVGWTLLAIDWILVVYVPSGLRVGSEFWLVWVVGQAVAGVGFVLVGGWLEHAAAARMPSVPVPESSAVAVEQGQHVPAGREPRESKDKAA